MDWLSAGRTRRVLTAIDFKIVLKIANFARRRDVIAKRGSTRFDRRQQDAFDRPHQAIGPSALNGMGATPRRKPGRKKPFADIDIAKPRDNSLVQQSRFYGRPLAGEPGREGGAIEGFIQRFRADRCQQRMAVQGFFGGKIHEAKPPWIRKPYLRSVAHRKYNMFVLAADHTLMGKRTRRLGVRGLLNYHAPGHAEMSNHHGAVIEAKKQVLGAAIDRDDRAAGQRGGKSFRQRPAQIATAHQHVDNRPPFHYRRQSATYGFYFRQFRHVFLVFRGDRSPITR